LFSSDATRCSTCSSSRAARLPAFLLTLAVVDDVGTIAVIALCYSKGIALGWLLLGGVFEGPNRLPSR
jgi:Na+/H+ antiporter NhaA